MLLRGVSLLVRLRVGTTLLTLGIGRQTAEDWKLLEFKASQTGILSEKELWAARKEMGDDKYQQEFECSFNAAVQGSYYGQIINDLEAKGRITTIDRDDLCRSFVAWDLGMGDSTCLWVAQLAGKEVRLIDCVENHGVGLDWYVSWLGTISTKALGRSSRTTWR
jgi:phage terminase large subunit